MTKNYDAVLLISFGGPNKPDDVIPFLENVLRGKNVPRERLLEVSEHYLHFGGKSPINEQNLALKAALEQEFAKQELDLPIFFGNRNWEPYIPEALQQVLDIGGKRALAIFTSAYSSYSGCRQYRENIEEAQKALGDKAPQVDRLRMFFNHPGFIQANRDLLAEALSSRSERKKTMLLFVAHSIPTTMAKGCNYQTQLEEACRLVSEEASGVPYELVWQSRSGPPHQPWLEPDICDRIEELAGEGYERVVVSPIGFISDHMEVLFDLDTEAKEACEEHGLDFVRVETVGTHPVFVEGLVDMVKERHYGLETRKVVGRLPAVHDVCPENCCQRTVGQGA